MKCGGRKESEEENVRVSPPPDLCVFVLMFDYRPSDQTLIHPLMGRSSASFATILRAKNSKAEPIIMDFNHHPLLSYSPTPGPGEREEILLLFFCSGAIIK